LAIPTIASASLGGNIASLDSDQVQMKTTSRVARSESNYTVREMQLSSGTTVREYLSSTGTIFAVAWNGPVIPNLRQILGHYFSALSDSTAVRRGTHAQMHVAQADLVIDSSGHMRAFAGRAYLKSLLPQEVVAADVH